MIGFSKPLNNFFKPVKTLRGAEMGLEGIKYTITLSACFMVSLKSIPKLNPLCSNTGIRISKGAFPAPAPNPLIQASNKSAPHSAATKELAIAHPKLLCA